MGGLFSHAYLIIIITPLNSKKSKINFGGVYFFVDKYLNIGGLKFCFCLRTCKLIVQNLTG